MLYLAGTQLTMSKVLNWGKITWLLLWISHINSFLHQIFICSRIMVILPKEAQHVSTSDIKKWLVTLLSAKAFLFLISYISSKSWIARKKEKKVALNCLTSIVCPSENDFTTARRKVVVALTHYATCHSPGSKFCIH